MCLMRAIIVTSKPYPYKHPAAHGETIPHQPSLMNGNYRKTASQRQSAIHTEGDEARFRVRGVGVGVGFR